MTNIVYDSNVDVRSGVSMPDTNWLDRVKKVCSTRSLQLRDANLSAQIKSSGEK